MFEEVGRGRRYRSGRAAAKVAAGAAVVATLGVLAAALYFTRPADGQIPPGVTIAGIDVGGESIDAVRGKLEVLASERLSQPITLVHSGGRLATTAAELGAEAQLEQALAQAEQSRGSWSRLRARLGFADTIELPLGFTVQPKQVRAVVGDIAAELGRDVVSATVEITDGQITVVGGSDGIEIDQDALFERLAGLPGEIEVPLREVEPPITDADAERANARAQQILDETPAVVRGRERVKFSKRLVRQALRFEERGDELVVLLDAATLRPRLERTFNELAQEPVNARFRVEGDAVRIIESKPGREFDVDTTLDALLPNLGEPQVRAEFSEIEPEFSTQDAEDMNIREEISAFETQYPCCQPRVRNIQRAARIINGTIVEAGALFSLNDVLGQRTRARGFVEAPQILGDRLVDAVGGGVSQVATTIFNAAFFAGLQLVEHRPHSFYISRYPMGREATVSWGGPELVFRNDWPAAILIRASADDTSITFRFYSAKLDRRVTTTTGEPRDFKKAKVRRIPKPAWPPGKRKLIQAGGVDGFTVDYTREVFRGDEEIGRQSWTVKYVPEDKIIEMGPKRMKKDKPDDEPVDEPTGPAENGETPAPTDEEPPTEEEPGVEDPAPADEPPPTEPPAEPPPAEPPPDPA